MWGALAAGVVGWVLVAAGAGKLTGWAEFRRGLEAGRLLPGPLAAAVAVVLPPAELAAGGLVLLAPQPRALAAAGLLLTAFAVYQAELRQRGGDADCHCYGRLRHVPPGPAAIVANACMGFFAFALAAGALSPGSVVLRLGGGAALAAAYLLALGRSHPRVGFTGFPYAELRYVEHRLAGESDAAARQAVAREFGVGVHATYLMLPRYKTWWLVLRARLRGTAAPIG
jgi:hypothetical protein